MDVEFLISAFKERQYPVSDKPEIAFAGKSNVGKSSLINTLVNRKKLARTSSTPGRTQSINFFRFGQTLYLVDLPGYGFARVPARVKESWREMVETYLIRRPTLKAVVVILDIRRDPASGDIDLINWLRAYNIHPIIVLTKADKLSRQQAKRRANLIAGQLVGLSPDAPVVFSAKTRQGKDEIWERMREAAGLMIDD
ncbi:MAG: ribosome biogenesis GTP-binding protein YihA/YsxC [Desulfobacteraceae bacterium]|nr:ribosome biogenesis GTP-binding protein YihA/YsxC [Desulfobacteraceae bacterium]